MKETSRCPIVKLVMLLASARMARDHPRAVLANPISPPAFETCLLLVNGCSVSRWESSSQTDNIITLKDYSVNNYHRSKAVHNNLDIRSIRPIIGIEVQNIELYLPGKHQVTFGGYRNSIAQNYTAL